MMSAQVKEKVHKADEGDCRIVPEQFYEFIHAVISHEKGNGNTDKSGRKEREISNSEVLIVPLIDSILHGIFIFSYYLYL